MVFGGLGTGSAVFLNGSTSSIGQAVVICLAQKGYQVTFQTRSEKRGQALVELACNYSVNGFVKWTKDMSDMRHFEYIILGSSVCTLPRTCLARLSSLAKCDRGDTPLQCMPP